MSTAPVLKLKGGQESVLLHITFVSLCVGVFAFVCAFVCALVVERLSNVLFSILKKTCKGYVVKCAVRAVVKEERFTCTCSHDV